MQLYVWRGASCNFGDELNDLLWPRLLPGLLDLDADATHPPDSDLPGDGDADLLLGIGSVLDARHPADRRKVVAGAGFGGYEAPATLDGSWEVYWVRGPRTARQIGLPPTFGLGDPASLLPLVYPVTRYGANSSTAGTPSTGTPTAGTIGFMPHFESLARGAWPAAATAAGVTLIDPRSSPRLILSQIANCRTLLSEALHGVIVADALRVPWVALAPVAPVHRAKWLDWADTLDLTIRFQALPASSPREFIETAFSPRRRALRIGLARAAALAEHLGRKMPYVDTACIDRAASALHRAAATPPQLSGCRALADAQQRMLDRLHTLRTIKAAPSLERWQARPHPAALGRR